MLLDHWGCQPTRHLYRRFAGIVGCRDLLSRESNSRPYPKTQIRANDRGFSNQRLGCVHLGSGPAAATQRFARLSFLRGRPNRIAQPFAISAAKSGLEGFAVALAADLAPKVRVNVVAPTLTPTEMGLAMVGGDKMIPMIEARHPMKKIPQTEELAATLLFLHSQAAQSITGQILKVDGGLSQLRLNQ